MALAAVLHRTISSAARDRRSRVNGRQHGNYKRQRGGAHSSLGGTAPNGNKGRRGGTYSARITRCHRPGATEHAAQAARRRVVTRAIAEARFCRDSDFIWPLVSLLGSIKLSAKALIIAD